MAEFIKNYAEWFYLVGAVLFVLTLRGLSSPKTAVKGNRFGMLAMTIAVATTFFLAEGPVMWLIVSAMVLGGLVGIYRAKTVAMTQMPETVAFMHSLVGLSAVAIAIATVLNSNQSYGAVARFELFIGCFIGAITFSASVFAFGKLGGKKWAKTLKAGIGIKVFQLVLLLAMIGFGIDYFINQNLVSFYIMTAIAVVLGWFWIAPIGGGDMPVVVSLLNSFSGWAAAGIGFTLGNSMLIIAGSLVGSSGAILSYIMCKAMNRSLLNVLFGSISDGGDETSEDTSEKHYKSGSPEDAGFLMSNADSVVIVPGYGMAQGRAQNAVKELYDQLKEEGVTTRFAIHPVAGRMPGHMNVLLAEADVPYEDILEMDEINSDFAGTDVVLVIGANDVINPVAKDDPNSPIYGMPILEAYKAQTVMVVKRSMKPGYAGLDNSLFYMDKTMMIFGDAKKVVEDMTKFINGTGH